MEAESEIMNGKFEFSLGVEDRKDIGGEENGCNMERKRN